MYQFRFLSYGKTLSMVLAITWMASLKSYAQGDLEGLDSLRSLVRHSAGVQRFDALYELGFRLFEHGDVEEALVQFNRASVAAKELGDSLRIVKSSRVAYQMLKRLDRADEGLDALFTALGIAKRNRFQEEQEYLLNLIAIHFTLRANYDRALEFHFQNLVLREETGDHVSIRESLNNIGVVYFKLRNYQKALEYYLLAIDHDNKDVNSSFRDQLLINTALCYNQLHNFKEARRLIFEGLKYCEASCSDMTVLHGEFGLGVSYYGEGRIDQAKDHFLRSYSIATKTNDLRFQAENLVYLAHIYAKKGMYDSTLATLALTEQIAASHGYNELLIESYREYADTYSALDDYRNASLYQQKYITLKDSIYSGELIDRIAKITTNFQERDNLKTIAAKEETIARQRSLNVAIGIIAILACALIFVLYRSIKINRRVNAALSDAKATIEDQNRQLRSSNVMLNEELRQRNLDLQKANDSLQRVNEELDNFIYKTSHDIRGPLASLKGMCNVALMDVKDPVALNYLEKLDITAEKLNTILTRLLIVNQINNSSLSHDRIDFEAIVDDILTLERKKGIPNRVRITREICPQTVFQADTQLVRIILENLIDNAIKFYNDSDRVEPFVHIRIGGNNQNVSIHVIDNGIGISEVHPDKIFQMFSRASERSETGGIGLYITKTAAEKLGGNVNLKTTPEGYTEFFVTLPQGS